MGYCGMGIMRAFVGVYLTPSEECDQGGVDGVLRDGDHESVIVSREHGREDRLMVGQQEPSRSTKQEQQQQTAEESGSTCAAVSRCKEEEEDNDR